jgi:hypothetical protein
MHKEFIFVLWHSREPQIFSFYCHSIYYNKMAHARNCETGTTLERLPYFTRIEKHFFKIIILKIGGHLIIPYKVKHILRRHLREN